MAADDFALTPTWVYPETPKYNNVTTQSESMKKEYYNISANAVEKFRLKFEGMSDTNFKTLFDHYKGRYAGYDEFIWLNANIPSYILTLLGLTSENLTGRWVQDSFKFDPSSKGWEASVIFEKSV